MNTSTQQLTLMVALSSMGALLGLILPANAQGEYIAEDLFTIPWGDEPGCLSADWHIPPDSPEWRGLIDPPGPFAVSGEGEMVINDGGLLMKFSQNGALTAWVVLGSLGLEIPFALAINSAGEVLIENRQVDQGLHGYITTLHLLDSTLQPVNQASIPSGNDSMVGDIYPSDTGSFWIIYSTRSRGRDWHERHLIEFSQDGSISAQQVLYAGENSDPGPQQIRFVSPSGEPRPHIEDTYGYTYRTPGEDPTVGRFSPEGDLVYTFDYSSDAGWTGFRASSPWFVTWSGDVYILHATDEGAVLTKYDLNDPPVCRLYVVTPMPYRGPAPAAIEFDATESYDPDPNNTITYEWDFDGDHIFGEPVDDAYTGPPDNPTHHYTASYTGPVNLLLTDNHGVESGCSVEIRVIIE